MRRVVHELRNHLAVAVANVEAFRDGVLDPTPARLDAVLQALRAANTLLNEIRTERAVATLAQTKQTLDICNVITNEVLGLEALAVERGVGFEVRQCASHDTACAHFACDPVRVGEIVNNVVSNAIHYTPREGHIEVACRRVEGQIALDVTDDGPGVDGEDAGRIFDSGYRGSASHDTTGSGIGLALTKRFVEDLGGSIDVLDVDGGGARFAIRLPTS